MKVLKLDDVKKYAETQIQACRRKIKYCKFSFRDAEKYIDIIRDHQAKRGKVESVGPILCLGVRNGREIDCFRHALAGHWLIKKLMPYLEIRQFGLQNRFPQLDGRNRSDLKDSISENTCLGVEINPDAKRSDVLNVSFDTLPEEWGEKFGLVYSNAFDHGRDPYQVAAAWWRVVRPGGYLVLAFPGGQEPEEIDPIGDVTLADACNLFPGELIYYHLQGSVWTYTEYVIRKPNAG